MITTGYYRYANSWRIRGVICFLFLALLVRGLIPIGYMPDANALRDGRFAITFCISPGAVTPSLNTLLDDANPYPNDVLTANDCPFSLVSHQALALPPLLAIRVLQVAIFSAPMLSFNNIALPVSGARGPPLGQRAPPFLF